MARDPSLLSAQNPIAIAPATPHIAHVQLRDLLICPREQGVVNYIGLKAIVEQDLHAPGAPTRILAQLNFNPNSLTSLPIGPNDTLLAAGGQDTEIHLSYHTPSTSSPRRTRLLWEFETHLSGSINNSVLLTSLSLTGSNESSVEPRVGISNNDGTIKLYDIPMRVHSARRKLVEAGTVSLEVPINHSSISPDGRTLLSVGDSNQVYFHRITGGANITFSPITTLSLPPADIVPNLGFPTSSLAASFSTAFSGDGSKFAVASQEGMVAVWDVRSTKVMKVFQTDKMRGLGGGIERVTTGNGASSGWLSDDPWEWTRGTKAPGWCVRSVKFNSGEGARLGKEVMAFTEHTSLVHIVDARTFETHDIIRVPTVHRPQPRPRPRISSAPSRVATSSNALAPTSGSAAQQRRLQRNFTRRMLPVSNARRTVSTPAAGSPSASSSSRRPPASSGNSRIVRPPSSISRPVTITSPTAGSGPATSSSRPAIVQAIGDAFRIPTSAYSAPASIGDSTWRTLGGGVQIGPFGRGTTAAVSPDGSVSPTLGSTPAALRTARGSGLSAAPMPSLQEWASYVLDREPGANGLSNIINSNPHREGTPEGDAPQPSPQEYQAAHARLLRRQARAEERGNRFGDDWYDDDGTSSESEEEDIRTFGYRGRILTMDDYFRTVREERERRRRQEEWIQRERELEQEEARMQEQEGIVVVPDLGDRDVENDVHALLAAHAIPSRLSGDHEQQVDGVVDLDEGFDDEFDFGVEMDRDTNTGSTHGDYEYPLYGRRTRRRMELQQRLGPVAPGDMVFDEAEEEGADVEEDRMNVDVEDEADRDTDVRIEEVDVDVDGEGEDDLDCLSSSNSRSASPTFGSGSGSIVIRNGNERVRTSPSASSRYGGVSRSTLARESSPKHDDTDLDDDETESGGAYYSHRKGADSQPNLVYYDDLDIAGLCFDPWGERMYVAGVGTNVTSGTMGSNGSMFSGSFGSRAAAAGNVVENVGAVVEWGVRGADKRWWVDDGWM